MPVKLISIKLDKERQLRFAMPNLCALEDELGFSLPTLMGELTAGRVSFNNIVKLIWAGLLQVDEEGNMKPDNLTFQKVRGLLNPADLEEYVLKVGEALNNAFIKKDDSKNGAGPKPAVTDSNPKSGTSKSS